MEYTYEKYIKDVESGQIRTGNSLKKAIERFKEFRKRSDIVFDEAQVRRCIDFVGTLKHFLGKSAGQPFILEPWQQFLICNLIGLKWKDTGRRVCRETYIQVARKSGKTALLAAIALYLMVADGEASPQIVAAANSTSQAHIIFDYITKFAAQLDASKKTLKPYRDTLKCPANDGYIKVISSDASRADGLNLSAYIIDEMHEQKNRKLYDVLKSSQGMRESPLAFIITTAGFDLNGTCHDFYELSIEILNGVKQMDNYFPFIFELDPDDDWKDPNNFIKCQPSLGVTVTTEFMLQEVHKAEMDSTALNGILTKTFNRWVSSLTAWIPQEIVVKTMQTVKLEDYAGKSIILGCDLGSVSDFSSISALIPPDESTGNKFVFKTWTFLPEATLEGHPHELLYRKFIAEGSMIITPGNTADYDYIISKIGEISAICPIAKIATDSWNANAMMVSLTNLGYTVVPFSQAIGNFNGPTKEMERLIKNDGLIIDKSANILWQFGNAALKYDHNQNCKVSKESAYKKVDSIISMTTALGEYIKEPIDNTLEIYVL